ncbi:helix-turn-helix domain-containing protein [Streptoverticillium reticulum]|uniref:helix-turn-helix domain-containing protein n=1 Tax=Streptoverticillium reticulum TaxID=1433415 RepID=UPI0039BEFC36
MGSIVSQGRKAGASALTVLELLAAEAPISHFESLVDDARRQGMGEADLALLETAKRLGLAVYAQAERRQRKEARLAAFIEAGKGIATVFDVPSLLSVLALKARQLFDLDIAWITVFGRDAGTVTVSACDGHTTALRTGLRIPDDPAMSSANAPFWTPDFTTDERLAHSYALDSLMESEGIHAVAAIPLTDGARPFGTLYVAGRSARWFTSAEVSLMTSLAELADLTIEKTRMLERAADCLSGAEGRRDEARTAAETAAVHGRLMSVVLDGGGLDALLDEAGRHLRGALRVHAPDGGILAGTDGMPAESETDTLRAMVDAHALREPILLDCGLWAAPLLAGDRDLGTLLLHPARPLADGDDRLLSLTAQTVAALLLLQHTTAPSASGHDRDWLLDDLLTSAQRPAGRFEERAARLGIDLTRPHVVVVARPEDEVQDNRTAIWASSYARRMNGLKSMHAGCAVLLLPGTDATAAAEQVSRGLTPLLDRPVTVCASGPVTSPAGVSAAFQEALRCLEAMIALGATGGFTSSGEHGFLGVLLSDTHDVEGFIRSMIGPLVAYDTQRYTEFTRTLDAYFDAGGSINRTAERLHVHPNTVGRRLERIGDLLGTNWQQPERAFEIQLALRLSRIQHVLKTRRPSLGSD